MGDRGFINGETAYYPVVGGGQIRHRGVGGKGEQTRNTKGQREGERSRVLLSDRVNNTQG